MSTHAPPRILYTRALPLRLGQLLCNDPVQTPYTTLDAIRPPLYRSAMKQFDCDSDSTATGPAHDRSGAPLFTFLEVAEQLYERIAQALGQVGLSYAKYELLHHLSSKGPVSLGILAEAQRCARSNITQLVDRLETEGLVRRVSDPDDRRGVRAEITPLGAARAVEGAAQIDAVRAQFSASLSDAESQQLVQLLAKVRKDQS